MNNLERQRRVRNIEFSAAFGVMVAECTRALIVGAQIANLPEVLAYYSGDFAWGYCVPWLINSNIELSGWNKRISENKRWLIGGGFALGTAILNETVLPILGTPRVADIPAAVVGLGCAYAVRRFAQHWVNSH